MMSRPGDAKRLIMDVIELREKVFTEWDWPVEAPGDIAVYIEVNGTPLCPLLNRYLDPLAYPLRDARGCLRETPHYPDSFAYADEIYPPSLELFGVSDWWIETCADGQFEEAFARHRGILQGCHEVGPHLYQAHVSARITLLEHSVIWDDFYAYWMYKKRLNGPPIYRKQPRFEFDRKQYEAQILRRSTRINNIAVEYHAASTSSVSPSINVEEAYLSSAVFPCKLSTVLVIGTCEGPLEDVHRLALVRDGEPLFRYRWCDPLIGDSGRRPFYLVLQEQLLEPVLICHIEMYRELDVDEREVPQRLATIELHLI